MGGIARRSPITAQRSRQGRAKRACEHGQRPRAGLDGENAVIRCGDSGKPALSCSSLMTAGRPCIRRPHGLTRAPASSQRPGRHVSKILDGRRFVVDEPQAVQVYELVTGDVPFEVATRAFRLLPIREA